MEFHVSRQARDRYRFDQSLFSLTGNVIFANFHAARVFTQKINQKRDLARFPEQAVKAGQINAMGMIDEIFHYVIGLYRQQANPQAISHALEYLDDRIGAQPVDTALRRFVDGFPSLTVYRGEMSAAEYLEGATEGVPNRQVTLEEMVMLWLANTNPAMTPFRELFDDTGLAHDTVYPRMIAGLQDFFSEQPPFGPQHQSLIDMLRSPALAVPYSLPGQLEYIREHWAALLGKFLYRLLGSLDLLREEERAAFTGPGPTVVLDYLSARGLGEPERFSPDREWMPSLVLIAKNTYVWLDQLSRKYRRPITRLDQVPDEELAALHSWGISGLWLIGLWERSRASQRIKQLTGNPEAVASAYSLDSYQIASDLGGPDAYANLKDRAARHGLRMASDMVPNHMGIDSQWVLHHPDWFISLDHSPFPSYTFNGPDLSPDPRVSIFLEDHYYTRTDAAVGFLRRDNQNGEHRFIYHGNDGTALPWNDTAQLDYLKAEVREAVIQTILHVARQFPIIRFDAAMTLAKKHYQRLWFPEPGGGGAIPSRAEHGLTRAEFDRLMPEEFWREVVDRVSQEAPDTLLLAEAFWLMESYFVRTLGMHRVYNSAFMNMLRNEENAKYRSLMKNTLEFEPEILKRFVNFMNNPDERTAVEQFGKEDKYFGICTLMVTLPGLPMFGHGQIEGYAEKYGMEYRRAYLDETPDPYLIERHERQIFPLVRRRYLFAGVEHFWLYDLFTPEGTVDENVYAYSNQAGSERALVIYHNRFGSTRGWIRTSVGQLVKSGGERAVRQRTLGEGLGLTPDPRFYTIFRDQAQGHEYIRSSQELSEKGLYVELNAYQTQVFMDFREVQENEWGQYSQLAAYLNGRGVPSIDEALQELVLQPILQPFQRLVNPERFNILLAARRMSPDDRLDAGLLEAVGRDTLTLLYRIKERTGGAGDPEAIAAEIRQELSVLLQLPVLETAFPFPPGRKYQAGLEYLQEGLSENPELWVTLFGWCFTHRLGEIVGGGDPADISRSWVDEWQLGRIIAETARGLGLDENGAWGSVNQIKFLISQSGRSREGFGKSAYEVVEAWLQDPEIQRFLGINRYQGVLWFNQQAFQALLWWMDLISIIEAGSQPAEANQSFAEQVIAGHELVRALQAAESASGFQVEKLMDALEDRSGKKPETTVEEGKQRS